MPPTWIVAPDGTRSPGRIAVAQPTPIDEDNFECVVALEHARADRYPPIGGASSLQALLLGSQLLGHDLHWHLARGGRVLYPDSDDDVSLDALFGPLIRSPG